MSNTLVTMFKIKELRNRILYTLMILIVYRIGVQIPVPGINYSALINYLNQSQGQTDTLFSYLNFFAGGAFNNLSIFALGIMPYITASIIMQLLMIIVPSLKRMAEEEGGRKKFNQYVRVGTVLVCLVQSFMTIDFASRLRGQSSIIELNPFWLFSLTTIIITTCGSLVIMWLGERITEKGIGNGISLIIFAGIVARVPYAIIDLVKKVRGNQLDIPIVLMILILLVVIIALVIYEQQGQRKIPVHYAKRIIGRKMYGSPPTYLPFKINPSGVIPIIFANSLMMAPQSLGNIFKNVSWVNTFSNWFAHDKLPYLFFYSILIVFFAYFYTQVTLNPVEIAKNIRENGGAIPGIPPNKVEEYLMRVLNRIVLPGSIFLAFIAIIPTLIIKFVPDFSHEFAFLLGGTSLIILVGVDLDTMSQIESHLKMHHHDGLVKKGKIRSRNF